MEDKIYTREELEKKLTEKQKKFCALYVVEWNGYKSYKEAYPDSSDDSARVSASNLLTNPNIKQYISFIKDDYEMLCGISKTKQINELAKIAYSGISDLHNTWIELNEWEQIKENNPNAMAAIESIDTKTETKTFDEQQIEVKYIKIKLHSKIAALTEINKMMGYNAAQKFEHSGEVKTDFSEKSIDELRLIAEQLAKDVLKQNE